MGTFAGYTGAMMIPEHLKEEFCVRMLKILSYGGMMDTEIVKIYQNEVDLLIPVEINTKGKTVFFYNYFEDDSWETAGFDTESCRLRTNKVGYYEFNRIICAAYTLYELYDEHSGLVKINGTIVNSSPFVGWFNHLFGTKYSVENRRKLWDNAETYVYDGDYVWSFEFCNLMNMIPGKKLEIAGGTEFTDLCYITKGTESLDNRTLAPGSYPSDVYACKKSIVTFLGKTRKDSNAERLYSLVCLKRDKRERIDDKSIKRVAEWSLVLPARVLVYLTTQITGERFWERWKKLRADVYHDEKTKTYVGQRLERKRLSEWQKPIPKVKTIDILREGSSMAFWSTPDELEKELKYCVSDDDRLFWWDGSDEVVISQKMEKWLIELAERYSNIVKSIQDANSSDDFLKDFIQLLVEINEKYERIYPFQSMFYEFIGNAYRKEFRAAIILLRELTEENWEDGKAIKLRNSYWELTSRKLTFNPGRRNIKRYMSILANQKLRRKYFGF